MGHVAAVLWDWLVSHVDEVVEGRDVGARRECRGAAVRSVVVLNGDEFSQQRYLLVLLHNQLEERVNGSTLRHMPNSGNGDVAIGEPSLKARPLVS